MATYSTPGVYVSEAALTSLTPTISGATAAMFFGTAARGATAAPAVINDWPTYKNLFGDLDNAYDLGYAVYHYFANGGRSCYVNRVVGAGSVSAFKTAVPFYPNGIGNASISFCTATADNPGAWGNAVTLVFTAGNLIASSSNKPTFNLSVQVNGVEVEKWLELSPDVNSNRYFVTTLNLYSNFVTISNPTSFTSSSSPASAGVVYASTPVALAGGTDVAVGQSDFTTAFNNMDYINGNLLLNCVGNTTPATISALVAKASTRGDSFVIIDPSLTDTQFAQTQTTAANFAGTGTPGYCAAYAPSLLMVDPAKTGPSAIRNTYPGGAVAGLFIRSELERTVAKAPAGYQADVRGAIATAYPITDNQIGTLYTSTPAVNSFRTVNGAGLTVYGTRTFEPVKPDRYIPVRRTLNYLKQSLKDLTQFAVFEPNDQNLWNRINNTTGSFLTNFWRTGALKGDTAANAFFVVCDSTNNTPTTVDQGIVNVSVGVALEYPAEYIQITLSQWTGGSNAVES